MKKKEVRKCFPSLIIWYSINTDSDALCEDMANYCTGRTQITNEGNRYDCKDSAQKPRPVLRTLLQLWHSGSKHSQDVLERQRTHERRKQFSLINQQWHWEVIFLRQPTAREDRMGGEVHCNAAQHQKSPGHPLRGTAKTQRARSSKVSWHKHRRGPFYRCIVWPETRRTQASTRGRFAAAHCMLPN